VRYPQALVVAAWIRLLIASSTALVIRVLEPAQHVCSVSVERIDEVLEGIESTVRSINAGAQVLEIGRGIGGAELPEIFEIQLQLIGGGGLPIVPAKIAQVFPLSGLRLLCFLSQI
jgi:hypothetical protein